MFKRCLCEVPQINGGEKSLMESSMMSFRGPQFGLYARNLLHLCRHKYVEIFTISGPSASSCQGTEKFSYFLRPLFVSFQNVDSPVRYVAGKSGIYVI